MELLAVRLARLITLFPTDEINPRGRTLMPDITPAFVKRYGFLKYPQTYAEFDETKGVTFEGGYWKSIAVDRIVLYNNGVMVDTRSSTSDSEKVLEDALIWAAENFGLTYHPEMLARKAYLSELEVKCEARIEMLNPQLKSFAKRLSERASSSAGQNLSYEAFSIGFNFDSAFAKAFSGPMRFERLTDVPYSDNKYFTSAPVPTDAHMLFLDELEAILRG